ncbi:MAG: Gfo/Idh/MocA family oxidoreductase [Armatimonadota bacterium]|nr:Gfo/Idh/MocA family oxidoreductase [Armatimonadota bacterium]
MTPSGHRHATGEAQVQTAVIGCGNLGRTHSEQLLQIEDAAMTAFCDINEDAARELCEQFGGDYFTTDLQRVLGDDEIAAVYICTPHDSHAELCVRAAEAGKHILVEKPLALTVEDCQAVGQAVERTGVKLFTAFKMRYYELILRAREIIPEPIMVTMQMMDFPWAATAWANDPVMGGGNVISQGCHSCDILRFVARSDPIEVFAVGGNYYQPTGVTDNLCATFRFEGDVAASWVQGDAAQSPHASKFFMQVFGEGIVVTLHNRFCTMEVAERGEQPVVYEGSETGFLEENRAFIDCIINDTPPTIDHVDGLMATLMPLQAIASARDGEPKPVKSLLDG